MNEEKIDLFEKLIRFLAIKPLPEDDFDLEKAREVIKEENKDDITFIGQHGYFEDVLDTVEQRIGNLRPAESSLFIYIKGEDSRQRIEKKFIKYNPKRRSYLYRRSISRMAYYRP
jgi:thiamine pyrophosphokinase